jgi:hypothetical protein
MPDPHADIDMDDLLRVCATEDELHDWVKRFCGIDVPRRAVCTHHVAPFDYLRRAYFEPATDQVVHAPRGGGKTRIAAVATLLDLLHKPGIDVRILGGSLDQSMRMWEHLFPDLVRLARPLLDERVRRSTRVELHNGSRCAVLTQSQRAVRGLRVQKLRCDEAELFKPDIWEAAQLVTRSKRGDADRSISGAIDALSTLHKPYGLMQKILDDAERRGIPVVRWCLLDVLERCPPGRRCDECPLWEECQGRAKAHCNGYVTIDDAITFKKRVSLPTWQSEMLCRRPSVDNAVFPMFDPADHVREHLDTGPATLCLTIDFGFAAPLVCLWVRSGETSTHVIDEYVQPQRTMAEHIEEIRNRGWGEASVVACDPAGAGRNAQTAASDVQLLRNAGFVVRHRASRIMQGVELIRTALRPAVGDATLFIHPRCRHLVRALQAYRYATLNGLPSELPLKDGEHDHLVDALRYHFVNRTAKSMGGRHY